MQIELLFQIAGVGVLTWVVCAVLKQAGREELSTLAAVAGVAIALLMVMDIISQLFSSVQTIFQLY